MKFEVTMVFTGPMSTLLGRPPTPVSMKFSTSSFKPIIMYLKAPTRSIVPRKLPMFCSLLVSSTCLFCCQYSCERSFAPGSELNAGLPSNSPGAIGPKA